MNSLFGLSLRELEPLPRTRAARFLPFDCARIPREQALLAEFLAMPIVGHHQCARNAQPHGARLPRQSAAHHARFHVERAERVGRGERLLNVRHQRGTRKIIAQRPSVDAPLPRARGEIDARDAEFAAPDRVPAQLRCDPAAHLAPPATATSGVGCCAACGCSEPAYTFSICFTCCRDSVVFGSMPQTAFSMTRSGCLPSTFCTGVKRSWPMYPVCRK